MNASRLLALLAVLGFTAASTSARAGTFSTAAWTDDASTAIASGQTAWAYHFGATTTATVNGVTVTGLVGPNASNGDFDLAGMTNVYSPDDVNNVTGTGSSEMAKRFVYGGNPASVTVKGLTAGTTYTVSFFSIGWDALGVRMITFAPLSFAFSAVQTRSTASLPTPLFPSASRINSLLV